MTIVQHTGKLEHQKSVDFDYPRFEALGIARIIDKSPSTLRADVHKLIRNDAFQNFLGFEAVLNNKQTLWFIIC